MHHSFYIFFSKVNKGAFFPNTPASCTHHLQLLTYSWGIFGILIPPHKRPCSSWYGLSMATFTDGTTYLAYRDYNYSDPTGSSWTLLAEVPAIPNSDPWSHSFQTLTFTHQGDHLPWSHGVFTYDDAERPGCMCVMLCTSIV